MFVAAVTLLLVSSASADPASYFPAPAKERASKCHAERTPDKFASDWYSKHLHAAQEPSLYALSTTTRRRKDRTLRFTWLRTFDRPIMVRIDGLRSPAPRLVATELSGSGGYDPGIIARRIDRLLSRDEAREVEDFLTRNNVFSPDAGCHAFGFDGAQWIAEQTDRGAYHFIDRWSPERGAVHDFGRMMVKLTGWDVGKVY